MNTLLLIGSLLGFISVVMGASGDHLFLLTEDKTETFATAVRYNMLYAAIITFLGVIRSLDTAEHIQKKVARSGLLFSLGTIAFVFSLYLNLLTGIPWLVYVTPFGGIALMISWLSLVALAFPQKKSKTLNT
ncbi:MAG TPA: DUF423 domain-containing protein [Gammaproteobacteria bacterium]|nr:DUF423 domain-containing protein [Gammaproteobacteria bacterium]HBF07126.1 DUF423 domain-containing protein [Gammaproteobacteria bacterium]HCK93961.1 DUF423 domain-containing protein [Gammaproteobacteria bacterium]|tara:strand:- start:1264 stop:1659 length:396 start_codon:yes stop_codon:yes gene_type:complete